LWGGAFGGLVCFFFFFFFLGGGVWGLFGVFFGGFVGVWVLVSWRGFPVQCIAIPLRRDHPVTPGSEGDSNQCPPRPELGFSQFRILTPFQTGSLGRSQSGPYPIQLWRAPRCHPDRESLGLNPSFDFPFIPPGPLLGRLFKKSHRHYLTLAFLPISSLTSQPGYPIDDKVSPLFRPFFPLNFLTRTL